MTNSSSTLHEGASRRVRHVKALQWLLEKWRWFQPKGAVFFPRFGALFVALAIGFGVHSWLATRSAIRVIGTVTENVATKAPDGETVYVTHFRFRLPSGEIIAAVDPILSSENDEPDFAASADVPVLYPPGDPHAAYIATRVRTYFTAIWLGVLGVALFDFGLVLLFAMKRKNAIGA
jgi:hypothetical protein